MKKIFKAELIFWGIIGLLCILGSCKHTEDKTLAIAKPETETKALVKTEAFKPTKQFNEYWYAGEAEISSYKLEQSRYGETRNGTAVLVYVTEPFLTKAQVKADYNNPSNINVLKLNATKKFNTGIYPYSIMQSTFYPIANNQHAIKTSCSVQEWCGHAYTQLNNRDQFEVNSHSYFEGEADKNFNLNKAILENELWTQLRIAPKSLPTGELEIIPALELVRLKHKPLKAYNAIAELKDGNYTLRFPDLKRTLSINFNTNFPYDITSWEETIDGKTTKATKLKTIKSAYWNKNSNKDEILRKTLQLE
ncbi:septum formation inhibitor Maf [uncultured Lacinutrix sp.]|uniref:septum formation inhibitor Maf n=1 Tax=uncultured Lacinutrix sp. TaxID=574032 RepID=UPI002602413B|nr:septum formation inhibitor Maf [uncultured Lacinutrix sp.]